MLPTDLQIAVLVSMLLLLVYIQYTYNKEARAVE